MTLRKILRGQIWVSSAACLLLLCSWISGAQAREDGSYLGNTFVDNFFHITFDLPIGLNPQPTSAINVHASTIDVWTVALAKQGKEPHGIVLIAQRLQSGPGKIRSASDFLNRLQNTQGAKNTFGPRGHRVNPDGLVFDWLDWLPPNGEFDSAVITQRGTFLLVARCNAKNAQDLEAMKNSLLGMRVTK